MTGRIERMSMEKLKCPTCEHYRLCSSAGEITDTQARTCKAYHMRKAPTPSIPRPIYGKIERYEYDVESGMISYKVVQTNADRLRSMTDEELAEWLFKHDPERDPPEWWLRWLKAEVQM